MDNLTAHHFRGLSLVAEQLADYFTDTVRSQMSDMNAAALYAFLLEVLDQAGLNADLTVPEFIAWAVKVLEERFPEAGHAAGAEAA